MNPNKAIAVSVANLVLNTSVVLNPDKRLESLETAAFSKIARPASTEILIAEIFTAQIPLNTFLNAQGQLDTLEEYYLEIYRLLEEKYHYFDGTNKEFGAAAFEAFIQLRYPAYYPLADMSTHFTQSIAKMAAQFMGPAGDGLFPLGLTSILTTLAISVKDFIEEAKTL